MRAHDLQRGPKQAERRTAPSASLTFVITAASSRLEKVGGGGIQIQKGRRPRARGRVKEARGPRRGARPQRPENSRRHSGRATAAGRLHPVILRGCGGAGVRGEARARTSRRDELIPSHAPRKCRGPRKLRAEVKSLSSPGAPISDSSRES